MAAGPRRLSDALSELVLVRGLARVRGDGQLSAVWKAVAGARIAADTRPLDIRRGVLRVAVTNAPLLSELVGFHRVSLLELLTKDHPDLKINALKFILRGDESR